jgi:hypothetical protein
MKNKQQRKEEAQVRQEEYNKLTTEQKILKLDLKLGGNLGAIKQRARLMIRNELEKVQASKPKPAVQENVKVTNKGKKFYQKPKKS